MLNKLTDILKEVFWLKKRTASRVRKPPKQVKRPAKPVRALPKPKQFKVKPAKVPDVRRAAVDPNLAQAGEITHYFDRIKVCVVKITQGSILIGDRLTIKGPKTSFVQKVWSMQIENKDVKVARKGQLIGIKVDKPVAVGDIVYK